MGKKRPAFGAATLPGVPFVAVAEPGPPRHFGDYGFDPQLLLFLSSQPEAKRPTRRRDRPAPPPLESARLKLHKPVSKKQQQRRRRWWSSAASAALFLFRRPSSSNPASPAAASPGAAPAAWPLYLADGDDDDAGGDDGPAACACWSPAARPAGHLAAAELGTASMSVPYASLRNAGGGGARAPAPPAMPIYLVT